MGKNLVSIIIPVYNAEKFINKTIESVLEQTYSEWELWLVDDGSEDKSEEIILSYTQRDKRIRYYKLPQNQGVSFARNKGIDLANGKYVSFLDADDYWKKEKLEKQIKFMENNMYEFTYTGYEFVNEYGESKGVVVKVPQKLNYKGALKNTIISTPGVIFNVDKLGKELIKMPNVFHEDTATWRKVLKQGYIAYGIDEALYCYRRNSNTLSSNKFNSLKKSWRLYRDIEKFGLIKSSYYFSWYAVNAVKKRIG